MGDATDSRLRVFSQIKYYKALQLSRNISHPENQIAALFPSLNFRFYFLTPVFS